MVGPALQCLLRGVCDDCDKRQCIFSKKKEAVRCEVWVFLSSEFYYKKKKNILFTLKCIRNRNFPIS